jgi:hypothetical protein
MFLAVILGGCTAAKTVTVDRTMHLEDLVERLKARNASITTLKGNGTLTMESPEESHSGSFAVELRKPDSLRVELRGPFGIRFGTLAASRDTFLFYNWRENRLTAGKPDRRTLAAVLRLNIRYERILDGFTGAFFTGVADPAQWDLTAGAENYVLRRRQSSGAVEEVTVGPDGQVVTGYRLLDSLGAPELIALASDLGEEPLLMPRFIRIVLPKERQSISIAYDDVTLNAPVTCAFTPPRTPEQTDR